jgi:bifunctional ADP-heptose synthase (sugar kinase/adenylyltransferase)
MQKNYFSSTELKVIQQASRLNVLVIGDSCVDKFVYGYCERISPEAPVPVLKHIETKEMPGMAGNVVENIKAFCKSVTLLTQEQKIEKVRYVDFKSNQHIMRFDIEQNSESNLDVFFTECKLGAAAISGKFDVVILSDYDKGFLKPCQIISLTNSLKNSVYVDSKKKDISCFKNSILKLNDSEYKTSSHSLDMSSSIVRTMGSRGASYDGTIYPSHAVEVFDVSGAGDTFLAAFSVYHFITKDFINSIKFANKCSSIVVQRKGTYALKTEDLDYA